MTGRIMIASCMSGGGKTTAACALMRALKNRGISCAPFKCGPDYIDPMYHKTACGRQGVNLDLFFSSEKELKAVFDRNCAGCDIAVAEGVMGYYDGMEMTSAQSSSYDVARVLDLPVVLIIPARGMAYSAIPIIKGMTQQFGDSKIRAVILNGVSEMTFRALKETIEGESGVRAVGYIPRLDSAVSSRHLGLVTPDGRTEDIISDTAAVFEKCVDIDALLDIAKCARTAEPPQNVGTQKQTVRIGIAYDEAFCFYYKDNMDILCELGAELVKFSPIRDRHLPEGISGVIFGGGYPELYARELSDNKSMLGDIKSKLGGGLPCLAECGGFMYLHKEFEDSGGTVYPGVGVIDGKAFKTDHLVRFGYINVTCDNKWLRGSDTIKAHEFHYWDSTSNGSACRAEKPNGRRRWDCMHADNNMFAGWPHLYYRSCPDFIVRFLNRCQEYRSK